LEKLLTFPLRTLIFQLALRKRY